MKTTAGPFTVIHSCQFFTGLFFSLRLFFSFKCVCVYVAGLVEMLCSVLLYLQREELVGVKASFPLMLSLLDILHILLKRVSTVVRHALQVTATCPQPTLVHLLIHVCLSAFSSISPPISLPPLLFPPTSSCSMKLKVQTPSLQMGLLRVLCFSSPQAVVP